MQVGAVITSSGHLGTDGEGDRIVRPLSLRCRGGLGLVVIVAVGERIGLTRSNEGNDGGGAVLRGVRVQYSFWGSK